MTKAEAENDKVNPFDLTKVWSHKDHPLLDVRLLELNRDPRNYFAEIEQTVYWPVDIVPGVGIRRISCCKPRLVSYPDAHRYLGSQL